MAARRSVSRGRQRRDDLHRGRDQERERHARHPQQVRRVRPLEALGEDADADEADGEQGRGAAGRDRAAAAQHDGQHEHPDGRRPSIRKNHRNSVCDGGEVRELPPRRDLLGHRLQPAVEAAPATAGGAARGPARRWKTGSITMPWKASTGPAITEVRPHRHEPDDAAERAPAARLSRSLPQHPSEQQGDGDDEVRAVRQGEPGEHAGATHAQSLPAPGRSRWTARTTNTALHSVRARPPFHAIAVRAIGVST